MRHARLLALAVVAAVLAGCGAASNEPEVAAVQNPLGQAQGASSTGGDYIVKSSDAIYEKKAPSTLYFPTGRDNDEVTETGAEPIEPCSLVSRDQAASILGGTVRVSQEPQGPTCVYERRGSGRTVTLVAESTTLTSLRKHARSVSSVQAAGQAGWCLHYGSTFVAVPLAEGLVLHVTGPCAAATSFAAQALPHVPR